MNNIEYRQSEKMTLESDMLVTGYAAVFNQAAVIYRDSYDNIEYKEVIEADAFTDADMSDVVFRYNHNDDCQILARTANKTLVCTIDKKGLKISAKLANTTQGNDIYKLIERSDISKMSFAFTVAKQAYDKDTHTRHIEKIEKVYDVSAVDVPAYSGTNLEVFKRSIVNFSDTITNLRKKIYILSKI